MVEAPAVSYGYKSTKVAPKINRGKSFTISNTEYLQEITSSTAFAITQYEINPGLIDSFPWLGQMGALFEQYRVRRMIWSFVPSCSSATSGSVMMATDYDSQDSPFVDKATMLGYQGATENHAWMGCQHNTNARSDVLKKYFTRITTKPSGTDLRMYDVGNFYIATQGFANSVTVIGDLWVHYVIEFYVPKILTAEAMGFQISTSKGSANPTAWANSMTVVNENQPKATYVDGGVISPSLPEDLFELGGNALRILREGYYAYQGFWQRDSGSGTLTGLPTVTLLDMADVDLPLGLLQSSTITTYFSTVLVSLAGAAAIFALNVAGTLTILTKFRASTVSSIAFGTWFLSCTPEKSQWSTLGREHLLQRAKRDGAPADFVGRVKALPVVDGIAKKIGSLEGEIDLALDQKEGESLGAYKRFEDDIKKHERLMEFYEWRKSRGRGREYAPSRFDEDEEDDIPQGERKRALSEPERPSDAVMLNRYQFDQIMKMASLSLSKPSDFKGPSVTDIRGQASAVYTSEAPPQGILKSVEKEVDDYVRVSVVPASAAVAPIPPVKPDGTSGSRSSSKTRT